MLKKEKLMQFTGYMLFKLKDFFIGEKMSDERANEKVEKIERKRERVISFSKLRYFCLSLFYHDSAERKSKHCARYTVYYLLYIFFPQTVFKDITNIY